MNSKVIILTPQNEVIIKDFEDNDIEAAIGGPIRVARPGVYDIRTGMAGQNFFDELTMTMFYDDEFLLNGTEPTVNAYATTISMLQNDNNVYYGNVALLADFVNENGEKDVEGLHDFAADFIANNLRTFFKQPEVVDLVESLHNDWDNKMPEPEITFQSFDNDNDFFKALGIDIGEED